MSHVSGVHENPPMKYEKTDQRGKTEDERYGKRQREPVCCQEIVAVYCKKVSK